MSLRQPRDAPSDPPSDEENLSPLADNSPERAASPFASVAAATTNFFSQPTAPRASTTGTTAPSSPSPVLSAFDAMATATNTKNPVMLVKLVARKVLLLITTDDESESDTRTPLGYALALAKDIILGLLLGVLSISFFVVLDHRNIIHFESAHNLRDSAYSSLSDPATLAMVEEEIGMKFMPLVDFEAAKQEVEDVEKKMQEMAGKLTEKEKDLEKVSKELAAMVEEKKVLMTNPKFAQLDQFCSSCKVGPNTCGARVEYLMSTYNNPKVVAMLNLMNQGKCKN